jgi:hypothetical protein
MFAVYVDDMIITDDDDDEIVRLKMKFEVKDLGIWDISLELRRLMGQRELFCLNRSMC